MADLRHVHETIAEALESLHADLFIPDMRLTLVARRPGNTECELVVTDDDLAEVIKVVRRSQKRTPEER
jgi:hypothetical protein